MEDLKKNVGQLKHHVSDYAKTYIELIKAKATKGTSNAAAGATVGILSIVFAFFFLQFLFFGLAWWLGSLLDSVAAGFFIVAGLFFLLIVLVLALRKKVIVPMIRNAIISKVYE